MADNRAFNIPRTGSQRLTKKIYSSASTQEILESLFSPIRLYASQDTLNNSPRFDMEASIIPIIEDFTTELSRKLDHKPSKLYRLSTGSPISYNVLPERIRSSLMRMKSNAIEVNFNYKIDLEKTRKKILEASGLKDINGKFTLLTHDIDCDKGLKRALRLKKIEERYDIESIWFLTTEEYRLDKQIVKSLAENGQIASHGTKHNGKLISLKLKEAVKELSKSKERLEVIVEKEVDGFRAPLLQYNERLLNAVSEAGFKYDSSMPTWEPMHPLTMKPDGIELIKPIRINKILEIPVTLPQDHQMIHILGLTPKQTIEQWIRLMNEIWKLGGISVLLIHPDYEFANEDILEYYDKLLQSIYQTQIPIGINDLI